MGLPTIHTTTGVEVDAHLRALGLREGLDVVVHSSLMAFGRLDPEGAESGPAMVYEAIRAIVGPEATVVAPSYTFNTHEVPYDVRRSPSTGVGALSEYVRARPEAVRSMSPVHNHVAVGPKARALLWETPPTVSLGPGSDFERLHAAGLTLVLLGVGFRRGCTYLHHMEALAGVPYRQWLDLPREVVDREGEARSTTLRYYARAEDADGRRWRANFDCIVEPLSRAGALTTVATPYGASFQVKLTDLHDCATRLLAEDPFALVVDAEAAR